MSQDRIAAVVLAAGLSRRMGRPKALLPLGDVPLIRRVIETIASLEAIRPIVVVTGDQADQIARAVNSPSPRTHGEGRGEGSSISNPKSQIPNDRERIEIVHNPDYAAGEMLSSVKTGCRAVADHCDAFFLSFVDQPLVKSQTYRKLLEIWQAAHKDGPVPIRIVQPVHDNRRGHPILISAACIPEILTLSADETLKAFTGANRSATLELPVDDSGVLDDIDTPSDYKQAIQIFSTPDT